MSHLRASLLLFVVFAFFNPALSNAGSIDYQISFKDAANHSIQVQMTIHDVRDSNTTLMMPVWTPGSYLMREYARNINQISAVGSNGQELQLKKSDRNHWQITGNAEGKVIVTYQLYCHEMSVRTNWVDAELAILNGASTFLTVPERRNRVHSVSLVLPKGWNRGVCSLKETATGTAWTATTFEELVDNPIIVGNPVTKDFVAGDRPHQLVSLGDTALWQLDKAAADVQKVVAEHQRMFVGAPYKDYKFLNMITEGRGGLEHDNCTLLMTSRWNFLDGEKYEDWLSLVSHEFFHTWNVRRLRPAGIWQYDLENENYTSSLWIAEGITSYYEDVALVRAGLIDQDAYLKRLSKVIKSLQTANGRQVQSLTDSSHDTWIKFYRPDENSKNSRVSYYTKGAVVAFLLDAKIRSATDGAKCLDDVMRTMYDRFAGKKGYSEQDFRTTASETAGVDLTAWFQATIDQTDELSYKEALQYYGLQFAADKGKDKENDKAAEASDTTTGSDRPKEASGTSKDAPKKTDDENEPKIDVGITFTSTTSSPTISAIRSHSAAFLAGLNVDDEVLAINGYRTSKTTWEQQLKLFGKGANKTVELTLSRRGRLQTIALSLAEASTDTWKLKFFAKPSDEQKNRVNSWLTVPAQAPNLTP